MEISFDGIVTETGFKAPRLSFSKNEYTRFYKATVVSGDITEDTARQEEIRKALEADKKPGSAPVVTLYDDSFALECRLRQLHRCRLGLRLHLDFHCALYEEIHLRSGRTLHTKGQQVRMAKRSV